MNHGMLEDILGRMERGGLANPAHHRDGLPGLSYPGPFDTSQLSLSENGGACHDDGKQIAKERLGELQQAVKDGNEKKLKKLNSPSMWG